jgi:hypothetical protein
MEFLKQKLSSRKLWAAAASGVLCIVAAAFGDQLTPEIVDVLQYAVIAGVTYIFGEGIVDVARQVADAIKAESLKKADTDEEKTDGAVEEETETDNVVIEFTE